MRPQGSPVIFPHISGVPGIGRRGPRWLQEIIPAADALPSAPATGGSSHSCSICANRKPTTRRYCAAPRVSRADGVRFQGGDQFPKRDIVVARQKRSLTGHRSRLFYRQRHADRHSYIRTRAQRIISYAGTAKRNCHGGRAQFRSNGYPHHRVRSWSRDSRSPPLALRDGFSTSGSLGIGLPGARRLMDEFAIDSEPGRGTIVTVTKWKS